METHTNNLRDFRWGLERETHRIRPDGSLSDSAHPAALKGPSFTKDFAESQLELVTRPQASIDAALDELDSLTAIAQQAIGTERFWPFSMPPRLPGNGEILTARMGEDSAARLAERYRRGLSNRYGIERQMICGVHVNVSFGAGLLAHLRETAPLTDEERKERRESDGYYLRLVRNLFDQMPVLVRAFGASPVMEPGSGASRDKAAFSYRNSPLGYARTEYRPFLELDSLAGHLGGIRRGLKTESDSFRRLGLVRDGTAIQLNAKVFQKEKEFYAPIRFRRTTAPHESSLVALERKGVEYIELRFFDVDPFVPSGVSADALRLTHLFLLESLTRASSPRPNAELAETLRLADEAALSDPLSDALATAGSASGLGKLRSFAEALGSEYVAALEGYSERMETPGLSIAGMLLGDYRASGLSWTEYGASVADKNKKGERDGISA